MALPQELSDRLRDLENYCSFKKIRKALGKEDYAAVTAELEGTVQRILDAEKAGLLYEEDVTDLINLMFVCNHFDHFYGLMQKLECDLIDEPEARAVMVAEYQVWKETGQVGAGEWLTGLHKGIDPNSLKARLFSALDALLLPVAHEFSDLPAAGMNPPKWIRKPFEDFEIVTIDAFLTDDGGLFAENHPNGRSFTLTDEDGAVYHLNGVRETDAEHFEMQETMFPDCKARCFNAMGWIEGYTSRQRREIECTLLADGSAALSYSTDGVDDSEAENDPRWGGYEAWAEARIRARRAYQAEFLAKYRSSAE